MSILKTGSNWSTQESKQHKNLLEALTAYFTIKIYRKDMKKTWESILKRV